MVLLCISFRWKCVSAC